MRTFFIYFIETGLAIAVNGLFLAIFLHSPSLRKTVSNIFLMNLMVCDILTASAAAISLTVHIYQETGDTKAESLFLYIFTAMMLNCLLSILLVTADRFTAVVVPFRYQTLSSKRNVAIILITTWLFITGFVIAGVVLATSDHPRTLMVAVHGLNFFLVAVTFTGIVFLIITNLVTLREVRRQIKIISSVSVFAGDKETSKKQENTLRKKELRAAYLCFAMVGLFTLTWGLFASGMIAAMVAKDHDKPSSFRQFCEFLVLASLSINPCLYVPFKSELRRKLCHPFKKVKERYGRKRVAEDRTTVQPATLDLPTKEDSS